MANTNAQTETTTTTIAVGSFIVDTKRPGVGPQEVIAIKRGWVTLRDADGRETKQRTGLVAAYVAKTSRDMAKTLNAYKPKYKASTAASGAASQNNGDELAALLAAMFPDQVIALAEKVLGLEPGFLAAKYDRLNPGQKRMNSGNRIRAAVKRGDITVDEVKKALH